MMQNENLTLFEQLISLNQNVYYWCYTPDLTLLHTSCPKELADGNHYFLLSQSGPLLQYAREGQYPFILDTFLNLLWVAAFEHSKNELVRIHVIGPTFTGRTSYKQLKECLDRHDLSVQVRSSVLKKLEEVPIIPTNLLYQYAMMLHYCITNEKIAIHQLHHLISAEEPAGREVPANQADDHRGIWASEQSFLQKIREGNLHYKEALDLSKTLSSGVKFDTGSPLRNAKNNVIVLLTLCSRAAIEGGLSPSISYNMQDYYTQRVEDAGSIPEISVLSETILEDYVTRVHSVQEQNGISAVVQGCCDYITTHLMEELSIPVLSSRAGYTEYYFSRKFKQEKGISISTFIRQERIQKAKLFLSSTNMSIIDISNELCFSSRSYFSDTFQKLTGESPAKYRQNHRKQ